MKKFLKLTVSCAVKTIENNSPDDCFCQCILLTNWRSVDYNEEKCAKDSSSEHKCGECLYFLWGFKNNPNLEKVEFIKSLVDEFVRPNLKGQSITPIFDVG